MIVASTHQRIAFRNSPDAPRRLSDLIQCRPTRCPQCTQTSPCSWNRWCAARFRLCSGPRWPPTVQRWGTRHTYLMLSRHKKPASPSMATAHCWRNPRCKSCCRCVLVTVRDLFGQMSCHNWSRGPFKYWQNQLRLPSYFGPILGLSINDVS